MADWPNVANEINGRTISPNKLFEFPNKQSGENYNRILTLWQRMPSEQKIECIIVDANTIAKILTTAKTARIGLNS